MPGGQVPTLRTRIYIDGYNLYYGRLKHTEYRWLDLLKLFQTLLPTILHNTDDGPAQMALLEERPICYFTAQILEVAARSDDSVSSQQNYHNALKAHCGNSIEFVTGYYAVSKARQALVDLEDEDRPPRLCERAKFWKLEEKQSDVNLALRMYDDAIHGEVDQIVLVTNDTDLVPALQMIKKRRPQIVCGLVVPTKKAAEGKPERRGNADLAELADWVRAHITDDELRSSQLPELVPGKRRSYYKPLSWYLRPDLVEKMIAKAMPVFGTEAKVMKWARSPFDLFGDRRPLDMLNDDISAAEVFKFQDEYKAPVKEQPDASKDSSSQVA